MKITREVKIGLIALIAIVLFIWLYSFLKGKNLLTRTAYYYSVYSEIGGLSESNPIEVSGYKVGVVQSIKFIDDGSGRLLVTLSLNKNMRIPVGSIAEITTASLIAGMKIQFKFSDSQEIYQSGDTIPGVLAVSMITKIEEEIMPLKNTINDMILNLDSVLTAVNQTLSPEFRNDLSKSVENINSATGSMAKMLKEREDELSSTLANLHTFSEVIAKNSPKIDTAISNLALISDSLAAADFAGTINRLRDATAQTATLLENLNKGEGSAGKLMTDDSLYINLSASLDNLQALLDDMKENPKRYVHFSLFGRKKE
jgi:phospholipid/cholesterol/gamma-HCH transport system substrate-binding protein